VAKDLEPVRVPPIVAPPIIQKPPARRGRPVPPAMPEKTVVAVVVGGWLKDQTAKTLQPALKARGVHTVSPPGWDDWKHPISHLAKQTLHDVRQRGERDLTLALIGHSFGGQAVCDAVCELASEGVFPAYVGLIDPVSTVPGIPQPIIIDTSFRKNRGVLHIFYRTWRVGPIRANIVDPHGTPIATLDSGCHRISGTHNSICHCDQLVAQVVAAVQKLGETP